MTRDEYRNEIAEIHELMKEWVGKAADPYISRSKLSELMIDYDLIEKNREKTLFSSELWDELYGGMSIKNKLKSEVAIEVMNARYFWNVIFHPVRNNLQKALELLNEAADFIEKSLNEIVKNTNTLVEINESDKKKSGERKAEWKSHEEALERVKRRTAEAKAEKDRGGNLMDACSNMGGWLD